MSVWVLASYFFDSLYSTLGRNLIIALDIGTSTVQAVIAEYKRGEDALRVLGVGVAPSAGVRRGIVVDIEEATTAIKNAINEAHHAAGVVPRSAWVGVGGAHVAVSSSRGIVAVSRADGEISSEDVRRAVAAAETFIPKNPNREVIHIIPRDFKVDQESGIKDPVGMHGVRLEVDSLIIECSSIFLKNLFKCVEGAGLKVEDYVFSPLAAAEVVLTKRQKELGVVLLDIGGGTANFMVFEEGMPIHAGVVPVGGAHITGDVAIGFRTHVDVAEQIKLAHGTCVPADVGKKDVIKLADFVPEERTVFSRRELAEIIEARVLDVFEAVQRELKKIERKQLLPAGVVMVGGSSALPGLVARAKQELGLPVELGMPRTQGVAMDAAVAPSFASVLGVLRWAETHGGGSHISSSRFNSAHWGKIMRWLKTLLP